MVGARIGTDWPIERGGRYAKALFHWGCAGACNRGRRKTAAALAAFNGNVGTHLKGRYEVPLRNTNAQGEAIFRVSDDGNSVDYKLIASNIDNAFMAHIHMGAPTVNGPIVVWLYPSTAPVPGPFGAGRHDGVLAEGTFTAANLVGPLAGHPLSVLIACNCDYGCPCNFNARPTQGKCEGGWTWHVERGRYGDVTLDGITFTVV